MKILVTGGAGFIGSAVCAHGAFGELASECRQPRQADLRGQPGESRIRRTVNPRYRFVQGDICDAQAGREDCFARRRPTPSCISPRNRTWIAASIRRSRSFETNFNGTFTLLEAARAAQGRALRPRLDG